MVLEHKKKPFFSRPGTNRMIRLYLLCLVTGVFTLVLFPDFIAPRYTYQLGDIVKKNIKAPGDFFIEDKEATEKNRKQAVTQVLSVYDHDKNLSSELANNIRQSFALVRAVIESAANNMTVPPDDSSKKTVDTAKAKSASAPEQQKTPPKTQVISDTAFKTILHQKILERKDEFAKIIGLEISKSAYTTLEKEKFSSEIENLLIQVLTKILSNGVVANKQILLNEVGKGIVLRTIGTQNETIVRRLKPYYDLDQALKMVRIQGEQPLKSLNSPVRKLIVTFCQKLIQPNITSNKSETAKRQKMAAAQSKPVMYKIKAGEMILREGDRVTAKQLLKLNVMQTQQKKNQPWTIAIGSAMMIGFLLVTTHFLFLQCPDCALLDSYKNLFFICAVLIGVFFFIRISTSLAESVSANNALMIPEASVILGFPIATGTMIVCVFLGFELAFSMAIIIAVGTAFILNNSLPLFIYFFLSGAMGAFWIQNCKNRKIFIQAGIRLGVFNLVQAIALSVYQAELTDFTGFVDWKLLWDGAFAFAGGILAGVTTAGIVPLVEIAFRYTTNITLLELANLEQPILHQLMLESGGTYHHSLVVGSMAEAAASEIGANPLLAKVCGYYHDIGKMKKPLYFIENQKNVKNRHDKLAPSMSKMIIMAHVKDGVEIAQKNRLAPVIIDAIQQHHGKSLIRYFYDKACRLKGDNAVNIDDYRYPGPKPQTREIGLIMLADVVEAASRTLENPTPARIQGLVQRLINNIFSDGQLDHCEFTLKDLHLISKSFYKILNGIYHHRVEYQDKDAASKNGEKHEKTAKESAQQTKVQVKKSTQGSVIQLKRLGQI